MRLVNIVRAFFDYYAGVPFSVNTARRPRAPVVREVLLDGRRDPEQFVLEVDHRPIDERQLSAPEARVVEQRDDL